MELLAEVIKLIAHKYRDIIDAEIGATISIRFYNNDYTLDVAEENRKLKVMIYPYKITRVTDIQGLEDIIEILQKQSTVIKNTQDEINKIKETYPVGTKVELIKMYDLQAPKSGTKGVIFNVDDEGAINVKWETGSTLSLIVGIDEFKII